MILQNDKNIKSIVYNYSLILCQLDLNRIYDSSAKQKCLIWVTLRTVDDFLRGFVVDTDGPWCARPEVPHPFVVSGSFVQTCD